MVVVVVDIDVVESKFKFRLVIFLRYCQFNPLFWYFSSLKRIKFISCLYCICDPSLN